MSTKCAVIIFAKLPQKGKVKTRLAKDVGENFATAFYRACAEYIFSEIQNLSRKDFTPFIFCYGKSEVNRISRWAGKNFIVRPQIDGDLGERMSASFNEVFNEGFSRAVIIGTDVPDFRSDMIISTSSKLNNSDFVIGPSSDGGYYLLGMNKPFPELFKEIEWSTSLVLQTTVDIIKSSNLKIELLERLVDIDTEKDLRNWMNFCGDINNPVYKFVSDNHSKLT